jgi:rhodanese-related sulfurtransferase/predicted transcriptional regulator
MIMTRSKPTFKQKLLEQFARLGKALGSEVRLELIELLIQCPTAVEDLAKKVNLPIANVSQHLQVLKQVGLVKTERQGKSIIYKVGDRDVIDLFLKLQTVGERHLDEINQLIERYLTSKDDLEGLSVEEVLRMAKRGEITLLDVRPPEEYAHSHLEGAINITLDELEERLSDLPKSKMVVAYCRGSYCILSFEAVKRLREKGYKAMRTEDGIPNWLSKKIKLSQAS